MTHEPRPLFDYRQPFPLLFVAVLHLGVLWLFQSGLHKPMPAPLEMKEVVAYLVPPKPQPAPMDTPPTPLETPAPAVIEPPPKLVAPAEPPKAPPKPEKPKAKKAEARKPKKPAAAEKPKANLPKPVAATPSETAILVPEASEPSEPRLASAEKPDVAAPAPLPAAAPAAPSAPPPAPVEAPRFDAAYLNNPPPAYPPLSRRMREEGKTLLRVQVDASGRASEIRIQESSGFPRLDEAARAAVLNWRFVPAMQGGKPVSAWVLVPLNFRLDQ